MNKKEELNRKLFQFYNSIKNNSDGYNSRLEDVAPDWFTTQLKNKQESILYKGRVSFQQFLKTELTRGYLLEYDEERFSARREKIYSFMKIPREVEKFMIYGFLQCADSFLFVYTFLPLRFAMALWAIIRRSFKYVLGNKQFRNKSENFLKPAEVCDLLKGIVVLGCWLMTWKVDTSVMYHLVKSQSVIKLYIFYNMLEVGDRLFSAFGQDTIDALFWTATEPKSKYNSINSKNLGIIPHLIFVLAYVFLHSILVLFQATTLNVAINSSNKALLTIMMSNNFVELKGSVFKKFDKNNLFQLSCSDVRERFHLTMLLLAVTLQTMKEYAWRADRLAILLPDCILLLIAEILVDWVKHAFITPFNELHSTVYREYTISLAYDMVKTRNETAFSDSSDLIARRMGFIPLPLGVTIARVLCTTLTPSFIPANIMLLILTYFILILLRILISLMILGYACHVINTHIQTIAHQKKNMTSENNVWGLNKKEATSINYPNLCSAVFSNSSVNLISNDSWLNRNKSENIHNIRFIKNPMWESNNCVFFSKSVVRAGSEPLLEQGVF